MDSSSWQAYAYNRPQDPNYSSNSVQQISLAQQLRDSVVQYPAMSLPQSLVQAAVASNKSQLNVMRQIARESSTPIGVSSPASNVLLATTPMVSSSPGSLTNSTWKASVNNIVANLHITEQPMNAKPVVVTSREHQPQIYQTNNDMHCVIGNGSTSISPVLNNQSGNVAGPHLGSLNIDQAVELKRNTSLGYNWQQVQYNSPETSLSVPATSQPPPRQSSQLPNSRRLVTASEERSYFTVGQNQSAQSSFPLESISTSLQSSQIQTPQQSPQNFYLENNHQISGGNNNQIFYANVNNGLHRPQVSQQHIVNYANVQQQDTRPPPHVVTVQRPRNLETSRGQRNNSQRNISDRLKRGLKSSSRDPPLINTADLMLQQTQIAQINQHQQAAAAVSGLQQQHVVTQQLQHHDLTLPDVVDGVSAVGGAGETTTISYEDLGLLGATGPFQITLNGNVASAIPKPSPRSTNIKEYQVWQQQQQQRSSNELLDLSSNESRDDAASAGFTITECELLPPSQSAGSTGFIPQIVMNPWDPNQTPVMTLAPLANAMQAYQQQWLTIQQGIQPNTTEAEVVVADQTEIEVKQADVAAEEAEAARIAAEAAAAAAEAAADAAAAAAAEAMAKLTTVLCESPDESMGFLMNLPPPCNVLLQPSSISPPSPDRQYFKSPFADAFDRFLKGEVCDSKNVGTELTEIPPLPGKKPYIPPYTPKYVPKSVSYSSSQYSSISSSTSYISGPSFKRVVSTSTFDSTSSRVPTSMSSKPLKQAQSSTKKSNKRASIADSKYSLEEVLPRREYSRRKAKDKLKEKNILAAADNEEEDGEGFRDFDLEDSDDDATWTPFEHREQKTAPSIANILSSSNNHPLLSDDDYDKTMLDQISGSTPKKQRLSKGSGLDFPALECTRLVPSGQPFQIGDFMILKYDLKKDIYSIWRLDSKTLIQRYNPQPSEDKNSPTVYRCANMFSGFSPICQNNYVSVSVRFVSLNPNALSSNRNKYDVSIISIGEQRNYYGNPELRLRSMTETSQYQDSFEVFIQALISQCLDSKFLDEVFLEQDDYFVSSIEKVDSITLSRKNKIINGISWSNEYLTAINTWSCLLDLGDSFLQNSECQACHRQKSTTTIKLFGKSYSSKTFQISSTSETQPGLIKKFSICAKCFQVSELYHLLQHQKLKLFEVCSNVVEKHRKTVPERDTTLMLNQLLANESWLAKLFQQIQELWADADCFLK